MRYAFAFFVILSQFALGDAKEFYFRRLIKPAAVSDSVVRDSYEQLLVHDNDKETKTFKQRFYYDDTFAENEASPVLFYLCGEATCEESDLSGAIRTHAEKLKARMVALEHRYYGESQPFDRLTTENLKFLSTDNALKDAARFQKYFTERFRLSGKWIVIGGSYPGSLSAYYRLQYPTLVAGSLASSAPVLAKENFEEYDRHVAVVAGPECLANMKLVVAEVEKALDNPEALTAIKKLFEAEVMKDKLDFVYLVADMGALAIQYGYRDHFCELLKKEKPLEGYAKFSREIYESWGINALSGSAQGAEDLDPKAYVSSFGMRQWFYQSCTEYGYWQNAYQEEAKSARSKLINPDYHLNLCKRLFGITTPVNTNHINDTFYKKLLQPELASKILFTNGANDPWSNLSITKELGNATNPNTSFLTIPKAAHCDDLRRPKMGENEEVAKARQLFIDLATAWLR